MKTLIIFVTLLAISIVSASECDETEEFKKGGISMCEPACDSAPNRECMSYRFADNYRCLCKDGLIRARRGHPGCVDKCPKPEAPKGSPENGKPPGFPDRPSDTDSRRR